MNSPYIFHTIRSVICMGLSYKARDFLQKNSRLLGKLIGFDISKLNKLITVVGLFLGIVVYQILSGIFDRVLKLLYPIHSLNNMDEFWLYESKDSLSNVSCLYALERCKFEKMQDFVYN